MNLDLRTPDLPMKLLCLAAALSLACTSIRGLRSAERENAPASLELLKKLAGTWVTVDEHGQPTEQVSLRICV